MTTQQERELAMRIRMALLEQAQSQVSRLAADRKPAGALAGGLPDDRNDFGQATLAVGAL